jgi:serine/threonine-protein kinase
VTQAPSQAAINVVIGQDPAPGAFLGGGQSVKLTVSKGPDAVPVPDVHGKTLDDAKKALSDAGFAPVVDDKGVADKDVPKGSVVSQDPLAGVPTPPGSPVKLTPSLGPELTAVPNLVGLPLAQAQSAAATAGLQLSVGKKLPPKNDTTAPGVAFDQDLKAGTQVPKGSTITVSFVPQPAGTTTVPTPSAAGPGN